MWRRGPYPEKHHPDQLLRKFRIEGLAFGGQFADSEGLQNSARFRE